MIMKNIEELSFNIPNREPRTPPTKSKIPYTPKEKDPPSPRITTKRGTQEAKIPIRSSKTNLYSVRRAAPWPWTHAIRRNHLRKGNPISATTEIQEYVHGIQPFYMARMNHMIYNNRSIESALKIKIQSYHIFSKNQEFLYIWRMKNH